MSVYRDGAHGLVRAMTVEANQLAAYAAWQQQIESGYPETPLDNPCPLGRFDRLTQDCMARRRLHEELAPLDWAVLCARYSLNYAEVDAGIRHLIPRVKSPAHLLFVTKAVFAWAVPKERRRVKPAFYEISSWDNDGTPDKTLYRWRAVVYRSLNEMLSTAHRNGEAVLEAAGLIARSAA